jgi:hypothetical protein
VRAYSPRPLFREPRGAAWPPPEDCDRGAGAALCRPPPPRFTAPPDERVCGAGDEARGDDWGIDRYCGIARDSGIARYCGTDRDSGRYCGAARDSGIDW